MVNDIDYRNYAIYLKEDNIHIPLYSVYEIIEDGYDAENENIYLVIKNSESKIYCSYNSILDICTTWMIIPKEDIILEFTLNQLRKQKL